MKTCSLNHWTTSEFEFPQIQGLTCSQYPEKQLDASHSIVHQNESHGGAQTDPGAARLCLQVAPGYASAALPMNRPVVTPLPSEWTGAVPGLRKSRPFCHQAQAGPLREDQRPRALNPHTGD